MKKNFYEVLAVLFAILGVIGFLVGITSDKQFIDCLMFALLDATLVAILFGVGKNARDIKALYERAKRGGAGRGFDCMLDDALREKEADTTED